MEIFPNYYKIKKEIYSRIIDLPNSINLRQLRCTDINHIVQLKGIITSTTFLVPKIKYVKYSCSICGEVIGPFKYDPKNNSDLGTCPSCQNRGTFIIDNQKTLYSNYQRAIIQEPLEFINPGISPKTKEIVLTNDLVNKLKPGDSVEIVGIVKVKYDKEANLINSFPLFKSFVEINYIKN